MRPRYIELKNFLGHEDEKVALPENGIFFLSGDSGSGKSSFIVDAVGYALFGSKATRVARQEQLKHKDHQSEAMEVRVLFEFDDSSQLILARGVNAKGVAWAEVHEPDPAQPTQATLLADTAHRVGRIVRQRLGGLTWQQFYAAFVARQSEISMLTELKGVPRRELVHRMLGMRELEKATEEVSSRLRTVRVQLKGLQGQLGDRTRESEEAVVAELLAATQLQKQALDQETERLQRLRAEVASAEQNLAPEEERVIACSRAQRLNESMRANSLLLAELTKAATRHQEAAQMIAKKGELEVKVMELESRYERLRSDYARSSEHAKRCGERDLALTRVNALRLSPPENKSEAEPTAEWLRTRSQVLTEEVEHLRAQRIEREGELARLRETGECFVCLRPLGEPHDHDRVLSILTSKIAELEASEDKCVRELVEIAKELPETQERERALSEVVRALAGAEAVLAQALTRVDELEATGEINADLVELQARGRAAADELEVARNELAAAAAATAGLDEEAQSKIAKLKEVMEEEREQLQTAEKAMGEDYDEEVIINRRAEVIALRDQLLAYEAKVPEMAKHAQMQEQAQATAERELASLSDKLDKLEEVQRQALRLEDLQTYLGGFQRKLASDIRPALEEMGSEMLDQVSGGKHVAMRIDDSYEIEVQSAEGSWLPSLLLSGGELIRVNICLRLALTRLVSQRTGTPARFLVLDEPLPSQDAGHVQRIMELLDSLRAFYPQIYIISHVGDLRSANEIDYVLEFESSGSERIALNFA